MVSNPPHKTHALLEVSGVKHGFFGRKGGVSTGDYTSLNAGQGSDDSPAHIQANRGRIATTLGATPDHLLSLSQIHSTEVIHVTQPWDGAPPAADGLVTQTPGLAISALSADCGPILFVDPNSRTIGACHAGWRGALNGVSDTTIDAMEALGAKREHIRAVLGPCISQASYEVGPEFRDTIVAEDDRYDRFFKLGPQKPSGDRRPHFDLKAFLRFRLRHAGLTHIDALDACTYAAPDTYFSYRYNTHNGLGDYGRNISVIILTE